MRSGKSCLMLAAGVITLFALFLPAGVSAKGMASESRIKVHLKPEFRNHLLYNMRNGLLPSVQKIIYSVSRGDMKEVAKVARSRGMAHMKQMNKEMMAELPAGLKKIGKPMHMAFDSVAEEAENGGTSEAVLNKLGAVMNFCTSCHNTYTVN